MRLQTIHPVQVQMHLHHLWHHLRLPLEEMLCLAVRLPKRQQSRARRKKQKKSSDLQSSITETAAPSASDTSISDAKGLSLSTEAQTEDGSGEKGSLSTAGTIFGTAAAVTISGLILMGAAAGILYLFRKNLVPLGRRRDDDA